MVYIRYFIEYIHSEKFEKIVVVIVVVAIKIKLFILLANVYLHAFLFSIYNLLFLC